MAHEIWTLDHLILGSSEGAWHRQGTVFDGQITTAKAIELAKMGWGTVCEQLTLPDGQGGSIKAPNAFATVRDDLPRTDPRRILGVVSSRYHPIQNAEAFGMLDELCGESGARIETAGTLKNGRVVWMMAVSPTKTTVVDDFIARYLLVSSSHDGSKALTIMFTPVRVVCWNTLNWAMGGQQNKVTVRHSKNRDAKLTEAKAVLGLSDEYFDAHQDTMRKMAATSIDDRFAAAYLTALFPDPEEDSGQAWSTNAKKRKRCFALYHGEQSGGDQTACKGTAYGLANAVGEWIDHERTTLTSRGRDATDARMDSTMFGSGAQLRDTAFSALTRTLEIVKSPGMQSNEVDSLMAQIDLNQTNDKAVDALLDGINLG